jgi:ubiquinone/menaquinone biosynthesis C-methylase UbiE
MSNDAHFTGERFLPHCTGEIVYEHWHRYAIAREPARGRRVLDVASGEGYGAAFLASVAQQVHGVDIAADAVAHARSVYAGVGNLEFTRASCTALPFPDHSFDLVVSFETIEHVSADAQRAMLDEFRRVLRPDGLLILSSPNKVEYSDVRDYHNEFHVHELYREELESLLRPRFGALRWFRQRVQFWSGIWSEAAGPQSLEAWSLSDAGVVTSHAPEAMYFVVFASAREECLPDAPSLSLFTDAGESILRHYEGVQREVIRLDELLARRDHQLEQASLTTAHHEAMIAEREQLIAEREARIIERDAWLEQRLERIAQLERLVAQRDGIIAERDELIVERGRIIANRESMIADRDQLIAARGEIIAQREQLIATRDEELAARDATIAVQGHTLEEHRALLAQRDQMLAEQTAKIASLARRIEELESVLAGEHATVTDLRRHIGLQQADLQHQHALLHERETVIAYRQRWKWWLQLPWFRLRTFLQRLA